MTIWLQTSASIQKRTSPLKFDPFHYPKTDFTASNLSTNSNKAASQRPIVLYFGSASDPVFQHLAVDFNSWADANKLFADFFYVYIHDATVENDASTATRSLKA